MEQILITGIALIGTQLIRKQRNSLLGYILVAVSWIGLAANSVVMLKSWKLGVVSLVLGGLFIAFIAYDQKKNAKK